MRKALASAVLATLMVASMAVPAFAARPTIACPPSPGPGDGYELPDGRVITIGWVNSPLTSFCE